MVRIVSRRRNHVHGSAAEFHPCQAVRPIEKTEEFLDVFKVSRNNLHIRQLRKLRVAQAMIQMTVRMHHEQRYFRGPTCGSSAVTVCAKGICLASATSPLSISSAFAEPSNKYINGASSVAQGFSRRIKICALYACT